MSHAAKPVAYKRLPREFIDCDREDLITVVSRMLASLIAINDRQTAPNLNYIDHGSLTRFHSRSPPQISVFNYLYRLVHYSSLENSIIITAVYYIDLLTRCYPVFAINSLTVHRFLLTATTVASKSLCDSFCSNHHYAKVGGVNILELNLLETEFLTRVNYRLVPRDFSYDASREPRHLTATQDPAISHGIASASQILDQYYRRMVALVGGVNKSQPDANTVQIGRNDNIVYFLDTGTVPSPKGDAVGLKVDSVPPSATPPVSQPVARPDENPKKRTAGGSSLEYDLTVTPSLKKIK